MKQQSLRPNNLREFIGKNSIKKNNMISTKKNIKNPIKKNNKTPFKKTNLKIKK